MSKAARRVVRNNQKKNGVFHKVTPQLLDEINEIKADYEEKVALANEAEATYRRTVIQALKGQKKHLETHSICLECGTVRNSVKHKECPKC